MIKLPDKWSVGTYVVFLMNYGSSRIGDVDKIVEDNSYRKSVKCEKEGSTPGVEDGWVKWFATLEEAEAFSKSLIPLTELQPPTQEWKPQIGDWVVTDNLRINDTGDGRKYSGTIGQIWKIGSIFTDDWYKPVESMHFVGGSLKLHNLRKATQQEIDSMSKTADVKPSESKFENMSKDELLEYAKKKYPIGCKVKFPGYNERIISQELFWQYGSLISHSGCCPILEITNGKYIWAEIIEMPKIEVPTSVYSTCHITETSYSYNGIKETHQSINKTGKQFSPIKVELIKVKQLKIKK